VQIEKYRIKIFDFLRHYPYSRLLISYCLTLVDLFSVRTTHDDLVKSLNRLNLIARLRHPSNGFEKVESRIRKRLSQIRPDKFSWQTFYPDTEQKTLFYSIILKHPGNNGEKGVLFVAFERNWLTLLRYADLGKLSHDYYLVLTPTWSPPHDLPYLLAAKFWPGKLFTITSSLADKDIFARLAPRVTVAPLLASSWIHPKLFEPQGLEKKYDIIMLANFAKYKRHYAFFETLSQMSKLPKVLIVGRSLQGRTKSTLEREAKLFGVHNCIDIKADLGNDELVSALQSAKVSLIFSKVEGSCVAVMESLFANVPVGLLEEANVGSRAFINAKTGSFLRQSHRAEDLELFIANYAKYSPREYVIEHKLDYLNSSNILNASIKNWALTNGEKWTQDIVPLLWRPYPSFSSMKDAESMDQTYEEFESKYGIKLERGKRKSVPVELLDEIIINK